MSVMENPTIDIPEFIQCGICSQVCKRGVKVLCCNIRACRSCATLHVTRKKVCWNTSCRKQIKTGDLVNDEALREDVEKYQNYLKNMVSTDTVEQSKEEVIEDAKSNSEEALNNIKVEDSDLKSEETEHDTQNDEGKIIVDGTIEDMEATNEEVEFIVVKAVLSGEEMSTETSNKVTEDETVSMNMGVSLAKMVERNSEFERCMSPAEKESNELRFGAQLELLLQFEAEYAKCLMCGQHIDTEFLILKHIQLKHKQEYGQLKTVLQTSNMNTLNMFLHKAIRSEFVFQQSQIYPVPVNY